MWVKLGGRCEWVLVVVGNVTGIVSTLVPVPTVVIRGGGRLHSGFQITANIIGVQLGGYSALVGPSNNTCTCPYGKSS